MGELWHRLGHVRLVWCINHQAKARGNPSRTLLVLLCPLYLLFRRLFDFDPCLGLLGYWR